MYIKKKINKKMISCSIQALHSHGDNYYGEKIYWVLRGCRDTILDRSS